MNLNPPGILEMMCHEQRLCLMPQRAIHWPSEQTLIITDPHFGKSASFAAAGIPVPAATLDDDLDRLESALRLTDAKKLLILGDFFHDAAARDTATLDALRRWRARFSNLSITLVRGNHDLHAGDPPDDLGIHCVDPGYVVDPFLFSHEPPVSESLYGMAGHIHPAVMLRDRRQRDGMRLLCFWFGARWALLPAFGRFTGAKVINPAAGDRVYLIGPDRVMDMPGRPRGNLWNL